MRTETFNIAAKNDWIVGTTTALFNKSGKKQILIKTCYWQIKRMPASKPVHYNFFNLGDMVRPSALTERFKFQSREPEKGKFCQCIFFFFVNTLLSLTLPILLQLKRSHVLQKDLNGQGPEWV